MHRERMAGFMDSASESFHLVDSHLGIIEINERAMQALKGVAPEIETKEDVVGRTLLDVYPFMQGEGGEFYFRNVVETGKSMKFDGAAEHPVHGTVHMTVQAFKVGDDLGIIATDISDRKRAEEERLDLERQMQHAQKLESLGVLAGGIAHDFNNLLVGVLGGTDLALQHVTPTSPARELLEDVTKVANRAADLANQLLAYSGKGRFIVEPTDLSVLVKEMFQLIETSVAKKIRIAYELDDDLPATEVDATQIRQIALNLVINAAEAIGQGAGTVSLTTGSLQCDREYLAKAYPGDEAEEGRYVYLEVMDSGAGMDSETVQRIFDPFFTTKTTGRGLGLAAALGIVRGHQGAFRVESQPGLGTTMTVLLPASEEAAINRPRRPEESGDDWQGSGVVLLVDDEEMVRTVAEAMLGRLGFEVLVATDGRQGVEVFRQHADEIVLVLLDMTMPEMNGDDACQEILRIKSDAKVLLSSGFHEQDVTGRFVTSGLAGFIQKPYRLDAFAQTIREILDS
jgi:signal transduction histidine kinase